MQSSAFIFYKLFSEFPKMHTLFLQAEMQEARTFFPFKDHSLHQSLQAGHPKRPLFLHRTLQKHSFYQGGLSSVELKKHVSPCPTQKPSTSRSLRKDHLPAGLGPQGLAAITWQNINTHTTTVCWHQIPFCCFSERKMTLHHIFKQFIYSHNSLFSFESWNMKIIYLILLFFHMVKLVFP